MIVWGEVEIDRGRNRNRWLDKIWHFNSGAELASRDMSSVEPSNFGPNSIYALRNLFNMYKLLSIINLESTNLKELDSWTHKIWILTPTLL